MGRKGVFGVIIAILISGTLVLAIETSLSLWQFTFGFILAWVLTLGFGNLRNAFMLFIMTLLLLLFGYISIKYSWLGALPGSIAGCGTGILMQFGWITQHKPFSRSGYIKTQEKAGAN